MTLGYSSVIGNIYFFPMEAPHFGHLSAENLKPALGGTSALQAWQIPPEPGLLCIFKTSPALFMVWPEVRTALIGFCPFLCGISLILLIKY
jgi:hypothetical protein